MRHDKTVPMHVSRVDYTYRVATADLNRYGFMHGGRLLTLADEAAYMSAQRHATGDYLTLAVHRARFHRPAACGHLLRIQARVGLSTKSSLWLPVDVSGQDGLVMEAVFVFVAVDKSMRPQRVAKAVATNAAECRLQANMLALQAQTYQWRREY